MAIQIEIKAYDIEVNERLNNYVTSKAEKLERYLFGIQKAIIELRHQKSARQATDRYVVQITVTGKGFLLRSEERTEDIYTCFDSALEKLHRRMEKYKGKRNRKRQDIAEIEETFMFPDEEEESDGIEVTISRRKKFTLIPMDEQEAIEQSNLTGHEDFYLFYNVNTDSVNLLYRRRNGGYGLIDTEIG